MAFLNCIKKFFSLALFCNQKVIDSVLKHLEYLHNIRVVQLPENAQLGFEELLLHGIHFCFFDDLHRPDLIHVFTFACSHLAEGALAEDSTQLITILELLLVYANEISLLNHEFILIIYLRL